MAQNGSDAVDVISKVLVSTIEKAISNAKFDKSMLGVVTGVKGDIYTVSAFGSQYTIRSDQVYTVGQSIVVTALQGDMKRLVCSPGNIGTMSTINTSVDKVNDRLQLFIDEDFANSIVRMDDLQDQIDGSFVSWFYDGEPTADNAPAKDWTTESAKQIHINDLYYDTASGYSYKWLYLNGSYQWVRETNSGIQSALEAASRAQDTADGKRRTFYEQPSPPYEQGDVWMQGSDADIMICVTEKKITESFALSDWQKSCKYTDDTAAKKAQQDVDELRSEYDETKEKVDNKIWMQDIKESANGIIIDFGNQNTSTNQKITNIQKDVATLKQNVNSNDDDISALDERLSSTEKEMENLATKAEAKNYASSAKEEAISAASSDATQKSNAAKDAAVKTSNEYTDGLMVSLNKTISDLTEKVVSLESALSALQAKVASYHPETDPEEPSAPTGPDETPEDTDE